MGGRVSGTLAILGMDKFEKATIRPLLLDKALYRRYNNNNNNRYRIACYSIELNASVDYMKPSFAIKSMNHCIFNRELDTG